MMTSDSDGVLGSLGPGLPQEHGCGQERHGSVLHRTVR